MQGGEIGLAGMGGPLQKAREGRGVRPEVEALRSHLGETGANEQIGRALTPGGQKVVEDGHEACLGIGVGLRRGQARRVGAEFRR